MNKTTKKLEANLIKALTIACDEFKRWDIGFDWLTHTARFNLFPGSLMVTLVFLTEQEQAAVSESGLDKKMRTIIQTQLLKAGIKVKDIRRHVRLDNEEICAEKDGGNWQARLARYSV